MTELEQLPVKDKGPNEKVNEDISLDEKVSESAEAHDDSYIPTSTQQVAQIKREEAKHKQDDEHLIKIILNFIRKDADPHIITLVNDCMDRNIPAPLIVTILSLNYADIINSLSYKEEHFTYSSTEPAEIIKEWYRDIIDICREYPQRIYSVMSPENKKEIEEVTDLLEGIVTDYYAKQSVTASKEQIRTYVEEVVKNMIQTVQTDNT